MTSIVKLVLNGKSIFFINLIENLKQTIMGVGAIFFASLAICFVLGIMAMIQGE